MARYKSTGIGGRTLAAADYRSLAAFRRALRHFLAFSGDAAEKAGIAPAQHQAMLAIAGMEPPVTIGALAHWLDLKPHSAGELVERMDGMGLVRRAADAADRRRVVLTLTPRAQRKLAALSAVHAQELARLSRILKPLLARLDGGS